MLRRNFCLGMMVLLPFTLVLAQLSLPPHRWTSLDGPYWAQGIDVAVGDALDSPGFRYLIGSDNTNTNVYSWSNQDLKWTNAYARAGAKKTISYREGGNVAGSKAFCAVFEDDIYLTENAGESWSNLGFVETNKQFMTLEIDQGEVGDIIYVGCIAEDLQASVFGGTYSQTGWIWEKVGETGLGSFDINDLEFVFSAFDYLCAATNDGFHTYGDFGNPQGQWDPTAFSNQEVRAIEALDYHAELWAATGGDDTQRKLYFSDSDLPPGANFTEVQVGDPPSSFNKLVNDISAIHITGNTEYQSLYIAASDGLYLLDVVGYQAGSLTVRDFIDFKEIDGSPFQYDFPVLSVDYFQDSPSSTTRHVLVGTAYNIYSITEIRSGPERLISDISVEEIVTGTFLEDITSLTFVPNIILTNSVNGLIKKGDFDTWNFKTSSNYQHPGYTSTDIAAKYDGHVIASSKDEINGLGITIYSSDVGDTWEVPDEFQTTIQAVELNPHNSEAYAAGDGGVFYISSDNGKTWSDPMSTNRYASVNDILADPAPARENVIYFGGSMTLLPYLKVSAWDGSSWHHLDNGLENVTSVNQLSKNASDETLYAATDIGVFKADVSDLANVEWLRKTDVINNPGFQSIVVDDLEENVVFASMSENYPEQIIYISADSSRSWIEYLTGDLGEDGAIANELALSRFPYRNIVAGTDKGVYHLPDVVVSDYTPQTLNWGPGKLIINGDTRTLDPTSFYIVPPCSVLFVYGFDCQQSGQDPQKSELRLSQATLLHALGNSQDHIIFTSSRPMGAAGDWSGIMLYGGYGDFPRINMDYCDLSFADWGINGYASLFEEAPTLLVQNCTFMEMSIAGIQLERPCVKSGTIRDSQFGQCGSYGIRINEGIMSSCWLSILISDNEIANCDNGIWYSGSRNPPPAKLLTISQNSISLNSPEANTCGINISKFDGQEEAPVSNVRDNSITNFAYGIHFSSLDDESVLSGNKVQNCSDYGLLLASSSPLILMDPYDSRPNDFNENGIGIYCDKYSSPYVRQTRIKDNAIGGVLIESHDWTQVPTPDFGTLGDWEHWGNNSLSYVDAPPSYYDMKYIALSTRVSAIWNWWGEPSPIPAQIVGNVDYFPWLTEDPLAGYPKREPWYANMPDEFSLSQNFPNPFNPATNISYSLGEPGFTALRIYNLNGQLVKTLYYGLASEGEHTVVWDGKNTAGMDVASGIYFYILHTEQGKVSKKMVLLR